jgi:2-polyprenyl-6-methoxyphenol hydroxylase-like FAD-dependent oxidoreductase
LLCRQLVAVDRGDIALDPAIQAYEAEMLDYGFAAVRAAVRNARPASSGNRLALAAFELMLRIAQAVPPLKRLLVPENLGRAAWPRPRGWCPVEAGVAVARQGRGFSPLRRRC